MGLEKSGGCKLMSNQTLEKMICCNCGNETDYDESELCLHCWCESRNLECQCGHQNEECED